jgi:hypothetical protein
MLRTIIPLIALILIVTPAHAGSKRTVRPPAAPSAAYLTTEERACQYIGELAALAARMRDQGVRMSAWLAASRQVLREKPTRPVIELLNDAIVYDLYGNAASVAPTQAQNLLEQHCLTRGIPAVLTLYGLAPAPETTTSAPWR